MVSGGTEVGSCLLRVISEIIVSYLIMLHIIKVFHGLICLPMIINLIITSRPCLTKNNN